MSKEMVKYHNDMNKLNLGTFSSKELDLFFTICYRVKESGTKEIVLNFDELKNLLGDNPNPKRFNTYIDGLNKNLSCLNYQIEIKENVFTRFVLFTTFTTDFNKNILKIKVNDDFGYFLNNLVKEFTKFELEQFVNLKSSYSKNVFKLLKQWETKKERIFSLEEFKTLLAIPQGYDMDDINNRVLKPIMKELSQHFKDLKLEKIKTGRKITSLKFTWKTDPKTIQLLEDNEVEISENLNRAIEKAKKNRFIKPFLTQENIVNLLKEFNEEQLIKGLNHAGKEVKQEIQYLSYLKKAIESGIEKQGVKIKVVGESLAPKEIEVAEVIGTIGERTEEKVEVQEVKYTKDLDGAKRFLFTKTINVKIPNKMNIINNLKDLESAIEFGEKYSIDMNFFKEDEVVEDLIEITASEYDMLKSRHVFNLLIESEGNIILQEVREKFDIENKHKYKIVDVTTEHLRELLKEEGIELEVVIEELKNAKYPTDNNFLFKFITVIKTAKNKNSTEEILNSIGLKY